MYLYAIALGFSALLLAFRRGQNSAAVGGEATRAIRIHFARDPCVPFRSQDDMVRAMERLMDHYRSAWDQWANRSISGRWSAIGKNSSLGCEYRDIGDKSIDTLITPDAEEKFDQQRVQRYMRVVYGFGFGLNVRSEAALLTFNWLQAYSLPNDALTNIERLMHDLLKLLFLQFCLEPSDTLFGHLADAKIQSEFLDIRDIVHVLTIFFLIFF